MNPPKELLGSQITSEVVFKEVDAKSKLIHVDFLEGCFVGVQQELFQETSDLMSTVCWPFIGRCDHAT